MLKNMELVLKFQSVYFVVFTISTYWHNYYSQPFSNLLVRCTVVEQNLDKVVKIGL